VPAPTTSRPLVRVVGLGPAGVELVTTRTLELIAQASVARLRTRVHPAAQALSQVPSYDDWYERAASFDELYAEIADDLADLARSSPNGEVLYAVPGSPNVAERTVELLREREDVTVVTEAAVSVIDVVCAALGRDPMAAGLRTIDALASSEMVRGPGPLLVLQAYAPEVLASFASRLPAETVVTVLHHVALADEVITTFSARELAGFASADHLTSLWIDELRDGGVAIDDLVELTRRLRAQCPWDQEQDHGSLTRHLLEEAYEALDALESLVRAQASGADTDSASAHVQEELGDLLFQIMFHAELGDEEGRFNLATIADGVRVKLIGRHPHVFGDVVVSGSDEVASRWEVLKQAEKGRASVTDGIAWQLPALSLYAKLLRKASHVRDTSLDADGARQRAMLALAQLETGAAAASDSTSSTQVAQQWGDVLTSLLVCAQWSGVDLEGVLRERATMLRDELRAIEANEDGPVTAQ
jgi:tetrapyrrole methylase family protein/MazG family protein